MKKILVMAMMLICIMAAGCAATSNLTSQEDVLLNKSYASYTAEDKTAFGSMLCRAEITKEDSKKIMDYVYSQKITDPEKSAYLNILTSTTPDRTGPATLKDLANSLKEKEALATYQPTQNEIDEAQKQINAASAQTTIYQEAQPKIQTYMDSEVLKDSKVKQYADKSIVDVTTGKVTITINLFRPYLKTLTVADITNLRNNSVDAVQEYISEVGTVEIVLKNNENTLDTYIFTPSGGWDKSVTPWK
ncbi:MAG TPA: hypothetical protein VIK34_05680 [Clostridiaceae bacterium]